MTARLAAGLVPGIAPSLVPTHRTTPGTPLHRTVRCHCWHRTTVHAGRSKSGRGAQIRRPTHLGRRLVAQWYYDRGL